MSIVYYAYAGTLDTRQAHFFRIKWFPTSKQNLTSLLGLGGLSS